MTEIDQDTGRHASPPAPWTRHWHPSVNRWRFGWLALLVSVLMLPVTTGLLAGMAPEPDPVSTRWQLDVEPGPLRVMYVRTPDAEGAYLYFTYSVTNNTGKDLEFVPSFELADSDGDVMLSGAGIPASVTKAILESLEDPFLQDQIDILGPIQQGRENAKHGLVIWSLPDFDTDELRLFGAGFSGETDSLELKDPRTGKTKRLVFRKSLMLRYAVPGTIDVVSQGDKPFDLIEQRWIMR